MEDIDNSAWLTSRYSRQVLFEGIKEQGQEKISKKSGGGKKANIVEILMKK